MSAQPLTATGGDLSREDRERLVEQRMENMRLKNEELLRRHAEVEADKKNADLLSSIALKENAFRKPPQVVTPSVSEKRDSKPRVPRVRSAPPAAAAPGDSESRRMQRLSLEDGPPPDPNYRFLADRMREGDGDEVGESGSGAGDRGGSRRHRNNYGGQDFENVCHAMRQDKAQQRESGGYALPPKLAMTGRQRREYEQWKSDRASIDQERMQRHMDAEGHFTREWDLHKEHQPEPPSPPLNERRGSSSCQSGGRIYLRGRGRAAEAGSWENCGRQRLSGAANGQNVVHCRSVRCDGHQRRHSTRLSASEGFTTSEDAQDLVKVMLVPATDRETTEDEGPAVDDVQPASPTDTTISEAKSDDSGKTGNLLQGPPLVLAPWQMPQ